MIRAASALLLLVAALVVPSAARAGDWRLAQPAAPAPPAGAPAVPFVVPLGQVQGLSFWAPNRGLMVVGGNDVVKKGLYRWDGRDWSPLSTVCGGNASATPIAWVGPDEFWVVADVRADAGSGGFNSSTLCHFKDGVFVASYATLLGAKDAYQQINGAACLAADDCWFAGEQPQIEGGDHPFRMHWDGRSLTVVNAPKGTAVLDVTATQDGFVEARSNVAPTDASLVPPTSFTFLSRIPAGTTTADGIGSDPFQSAADPLNSEFRALDRAGTLTWAVGGGALNNPRLPGELTRGLLVAVRDGGGDFTEVPLTPGALPDGYTAFDVAGEPGTDRAWIAVQGAAEGSVLVQVDRSGAVLQRVVLPDAADPDQAAAAAANSSISKIACPAAGDCWAATLSGWLFHLTGGPDPGTNDDPAFHRLILDRPADGLSPVTFSDDAPVDDSGADPGLPVETAVPPVTPIEEPAPVEGPTARNIKIKTLSRTAISISFRLTGKAKVRALAYHGKKLVSRSGRKTLRRGTHKVTLKVSVRQWPTRVRLEVKAP